MDVSDPGEDSTGDRRGGQRNVLTELGQLALESTDLESLCSETVDAVRDVLPVEYCGLFVVHEPGKQEGRTNRVATLRHGVGWETGALGSATVPVDGNGGVVGHTAETGDGVAVDDITAEDRVARANLLERHGIASATTVPVFGGSNEDDHDPWGVLGAFSSDTRPLDEEDRDFLRNVADLLGSAIDTYDGSNRPRAEDGEASDAGSEPNVESELKPELKSDEVSEPGAEGTDPAALADQLMTASPVGVIVADPDGDILRVNERAEEITGRDRDEFTTMGHGDPRWDTVDTDGQPLSSERLPFSRVLETGEPVYDAEFGIRRPDGERVWIIENAVPVSERDDDGITAVVSAFEDVTDERRLESELETTFERITDAFFGLDEEWRFTYVNDRARELIDPDGEGLIGRNLWEAFPAAVDSTFEREYRRAMAEQESTSFEEYFPPLSTWFEVHAYPSESGLSVYFRDVTERKKTQQELRENNRTLQRLYEITADSERSFDEKLRELLELGRNRLGLEVGYLAMADEEGDRFEVTHAVSEDDRLQPGTEMPLSDTYCQRTVEGDGLLAFADDPTGPDGAGGTEGPIDADTYETWGVDSYVGSRITVDDELFGTLCFESEAPRSDPFTPAERSFVELASQWVSHELERRRRQRQLEESERRYRTLIENFPNGAVALVDRDLRYVTFGGTLEGSADIEGRELEEEPLERALPPAIADVVVPNYEAALEGQRASFEEVIDGRTYQFHFTPVRDAKGEVVAAMGMSQDVTERKETERKLRDRERRLEQFKQYTDDVLDAIDDVFYVLDENGSFRRWNESLPTVTGYTDAEIDAMNAMELFEGEDRETITTAIDEVFETGHTRVEAELVTKSGERIPYEFAASALENPDGEQVLTGIGRDITARRNRQRQLESLVADLEESNERLEQFAYAASHDLQEPLRMVSSYLTLVERRYADELDEDGREFIEFAVDGAERMQEMIDGLLAYSRVDTQGDPFEPVDVDAVLEDVLADLEVRIAETGADVTVESLPTVYGDPDQLRQLFQNLIDNALTYDDDGPPEVTVFAELEPESESKRDGDAWKISVRDEGIGIDPDDAERIFRVFDRLHTVDEYSGTGIGLALCQRIVERHDGDIWVDSEPGEGSTFTVRLPATAESRSGETARSMTESAGRAGDVAPERRAGRQHERNRGRTRGRGRESESGRRNGTGTRESTTDETR
ncbi:histidine kinase [Halobiforma lacisalsi AJ5]|uniref:histidine kinase n=1 Tax=Natronobacterium lacisalsi AJ5 TaxID=358396 RepID=M0LGJ5_NATLA|nr:PAS domain-containing protein [Halobiforma lacisalsi]APW96510.1 histidine kinase [Halobiforma lacisalsi AJ5]EMA32213.1 multi-sensor signal transduction histidine kinase [Halobiforma lacisalsi AJ5]